MAPDYQMTPLMDEQTVHQERSGRFSSWVEISLAALRSNFRHISHCVRGKAEICAVLKADAYGHGAVSCALALQKEGAKWFAVTTAHEGVLLRQAGVTQRILLLGGVWPGEEECVFENDLTPAIWRPEQVRLLQKAAALGFWRGKRIMVHLKVNTGMNRLGMDGKDVRAMMETIQSSACVQLEGIFSHFTSSEIVDSPQGGIQLSRFRGFLERLAQSGIHPALQHMANSSAIPSRPESWFNMVRPGISLYGYYLPFTSSLPGALPFALPVSPVLAWKTRVIHTRIVEAGQRVGYGGAHVVGFPAKVAVLSVGYCDGLGRQLSSRGRVIVHRRYAPIIGNISMNLTTIDVTGIPDVEVGDEAILIGRAGNIEITAWEHARLGSTIPYEVLCGISSRIPRTYLG